MNDSQSQIGPIVGSVIVIVILIVGGLYFYGDRIAKSPESSTQTEEVADSQSAAANDVQVKEFQSQSEADDTASIQGDLNATNIDSIDSSFQSDSSIQAQ